MEIKKVKSFLFLSLGSFLYSEFFRISFKVEKCDENFVKECHIEYEDKAFDESVEICNERPIRDCQGKG